MEKFERTKALIGEQKLNQLFNKKVIIFGVGGVGGYVAEMLARTGVGELTLIDFDKVSESNINRQIIALTSTVGKSKVEVMKERILQINPNCKVDAIIEKLSADNICQFELEKFDYVADCIDMVASKVALIDYCYKSNIKLLSAMGAGNRCDIPNFVVKDIFNTKYDGLAKVLRKKLKEKDVIRHSVVVCEEQPLKCVPVGSIVYYPAMCGCVMSAKIIKDLLN